MRILTSLDESLNAAYRAILVTHENDKDFIMISVWMDGRYGDEEESKQPDEENCSFSAVRENAGELRSRPVTPPNRRWLKFCRHYLDD